MRQGPAFAPASLLALAALLAACSANPSPDEAAAQSAFITPASEAAQPASDPAAAFGDPAPGAPPAAEPAEPPAPEPAAPATSHVALKYLIGDIDPANDPMFARIPDKYQGGSRVWGHKDAIAAFVRMAEDAEQNGYKLKIVSAFRSFSDQKQIWEDKWSGKTLVGGKKLNTSTPDPQQRALKILTYSSMPATSRHHWGTDFDINSVSPAYFNTKEGKHTYDWLVGHASEYGFCQVYSHKGGAGERTSGYEEEKWHWSYLPVASWYLKQYPVDVGYDHITGFAGSDAAQGIDVIKTYVQAINPECLQ